MKISRIPSVIPGTLFLASLLAGFMSCSQKADEPFPRVVSSSPIDSLNDILLGRLSEGRILLLGDAEHHQGFYLRKLITLLDHWLEHFEGDKASEQIPRKLYLFLEQQQHHQEVWQRYFETGDFGEYLASQIDQGIHGAGPNTTFDEMEFLFDLRELQSRIAAVNVLLTGTDRLELRVMGAECDPPFLSARPKDPAAFARARAEYFIYQRDECSSKRIEGLLTANPEFKAIVYIGQGHLERKYVDKNTYSDGGVGGPQYSYFMPHYLDTYFGRDNVTMARFSGQGRNWQSNFIDWFARSELGPDLNICVMPRPPYGTPLYVLKSKQLLQIYRHLLDVQDRSADTTGRKDARATLYSLVFQLRRSHLQLEERNRRLIDSLYVHRKELNRDSTSHNRLLAMADTLLERFDVFKTIDQVTNWAFLPGIPDSGIFWWMARDWFNNLPIDSSLEEPVRSLSFGPHPDEDPVDSLARNEFIRRKKELSTYFLVNLLWVATDEEKATALKILQKRTGERFTDAKSWINWWRQRYWGEGQGGKREKSE